VLSVKYFWHVCRINYVVYIKADLALNTQELSKKISGLRQLFLLGGQSPTDTPEVLVDKFSRLAFSCQQITFMWSITLCSNYVSVQSIDLVDRIISS